MESFTKRDGLTSDQIDIVFRDRRDGSIWVGTDHGLDHFREAPFVPVLPEPGTSNFGIQAQQDGRVWIGSSEGGGLWIASPGGKTTVILSATVVQSPYEARSGTLWFGTFAPLRVASIRDHPDDGETTSLPLTPELQSQLAVRSIVEDLRGAVWASFIPYGLAKWEGGHWIKNGGLTGLPEAWVVILNIGPDGRIWAGYINGEAAVIDGTSVRRYAAKDGLNIGPVAAILSGRSDCWLAGPNGLVRFDGQRFHILSGANNRPLSGITGIALAKNGDLWLNAFDGVRRVAAAELKEAEKNPEYAVHSDLYDLTDGRVSCVVTFFALLWALYRYRPYQIKHEFDARLEERVGERTRIARDLHDTLLQSFQALLFRFQAVRELHRTRPAEAEELLESALDQAAQAITEGREAVQGLRASTVETNDLAVAIKNLGGELSAEGSGRSSAGLSVEVEGTSRTLHPIVRDEIYRIAGEALRNAFRHAEANQIEVELHHDERQFRLRIRDNGKGIDPKFLTSQGREGHFGMQHARARQADKRQALCLDGAGFRHRDRPQRSGSPRLCRIFCALAIMVH